MRRTEEKLPSASGLLKEDQEDVGGGGGGGWRRSERGGQSNALKPSVSNLRTKIKMKRKKTGKNNQSDGRNQRQWS